MTEKKGPFDGLNRKPKSEKGWQEWRRKYALALLNDRLDRLTSSATKKKYIMSLFNKWEKMYRAERSDVFTVNTFGYEDDDLKVAASSEQRLVEDQVDFIIEYIACSLCGGLGKENIARIKHFLEMQTTSNIGEKMELRFMGGNPLEANVCVDSLGDIDIADVVFITEFDHMWVSREKRKSWTKNIAKRFLNDLEKDVSFDLPSSVIVAELDDAIGFTEFEIRIEASPDELRLKAIQCLPQSFINRFGKTKIRAATAYQFE